MITTGQFFKELRARKKHAMLLLALVLLSAAITAHRSLCVVDPAALPQPSSTVEPSEFERSLHLNEDTFAVETWRSCPSVDRPPHGATEVNLSTRCADPLWLLPMDSTGFVDLSMETMVPCLLQCLDAECCDAFTTAPSCHLQWSATPTTANLRSWVQVLGERDWREALPTAAKDAVEARLVVSRGPPSYVASLTQGRWRGSALQVHVVSTEGDHVHVKGGARVTLSSQVHDRSRAIVILEEQEVDVDGGTISIQFDARLPPDVTEKVLYSIDVLFAPSRRNAAMSQSLQLQLGMMQMPKPVAIQFVQRNVAWHIHSWEVVLVDANNRTTCTAGDGSVLATLLFSSPGQSETAAGTVLLVHGRGVFHVPPMRFPHHNDAQWMFRVGHIVSSAPFQQVAQTADLLSFKNTSTLTLGVSLSASYCSTTAPCECIFCEMNDVRSAAEVIVVFTCNAATCVAGKGVHCIVDHSGCGNSVFADHQRNVRQALRRWNDLRLDGFCFVDSTIGAHFVVGAAFTRMRDTLLGVAAVTVVSSRLLPPHDPRDISVWNVPLDIDRDAELRQAPWWQHISGRRRLVSWLLHSTERHKRLVLSPFCLRHLSHCGVLVSSADHLGTIESAIGSLIVGEGGGGSSHQIPAAACYPFHTLAVLILSVLWDA